jgi:hypothetical protein
MTGAGLAQGTNCGACTPPLINPTNTPVQGTPRVFLIFWGPSWTGSAIDPNGSCAPAGLLPPVAAAQDLFGSLAGTSYNATLSQYGVSNNATLAGCHIDLVASTGTIDLQALINEGAFRWRSGRRF